MDNQRGNSMQRQILNGKIHRAVVTDAQIDYMGSISIDPILLEAADIKSGEKVLIANISNGARLESYAIEGERGKGEICLNGGAAKHGKVGDLLIVMSFVVLTDKEIKRHRPRVIRVDDKNRIVS